jgi:signal transduction histidine kinase
VNVSVKILKLQADKKAIRILTTGFEDLGHISVLIDKLRVQQILINLIQNALKFSNRDSKIVVAVTRFVVSEPNNIGVNLSVTDEGIGITEQDQKNLFSMFF